MEKKKSPKKLPPSKKLTPPPVIFRIFTERDIQIYDLVIKSGKKNVCYTSDADVARKAQLHGAVLSIIPKIPDGYVPLGKIHVLNVGDSVISDPPEEDLPEDPLDEPLDEVPLTKDEPLQNLDLINLTAEQIAALREKLKGGD